MAKQFWVSLRVGPGQDDGESCLSCLSQPRFKDCITLRDSIYYGYSWND
jgi:hypothetical protein